MGGRVRNCKETKDSKEKKKKEKRREKRSKGGKGGIQGSIESLGGTFHVMSVDITPFSVPEIKVKQSSNVFAFIINESCSMIQYTLLVSCHLRASSVNHAFLCLPFGIWLRPYGFEDGTGCWWYILCWGW